VASAPISPLKEKGRAQYPALCSLL